MRVYHGERTERGCDATVDGRPLRVRSDLSGSATAAFDWGFVGNGQLSLAMLSDFLGDDVRAAALARQFEEAVVARLPHNSWTMTDSDLAAIVAELPGAADDSKRANARRDEICGELPFGDMPVHTADLIDGDKGP